MKRMKNILILAIVCLTVSCYGDIMSTSLGEPDVVDNDKDGYPADEDCNDEDPSIYPGAPEVCGDGIDQDCDRRDTPCDLEVCDNDEDDDGDTLVDCKDPDCDDDPACDDTDDEICDDDIDNDGDTLVDCRDPDCEDDPACADEHETICDDDIDNDEDGDVDCCDSDCADDPACEEHESICDDDLDNDGDGLVDCNDSDCYDDPACDDEDHEVNCANDLDDDHDGATDCDDSDCWGTTECPIPGEEACFRFTFYVPSGQTASSIRIDGAPCYISHGCLGWYNPLIDTYGNRLEESNSRRLVKTLRFEVDTQFEVNVRTVILGTEYWYCSYGESREGPAESYFGTLTIERSLDCSTGWTVLSLYEYDLGSSHSGDCNMRTFSD